MSTPDEAEKALKDLFAALQKASPAASDEDADEDEVLCELKLTLTNSGLKLHATGNIEPALRHAVMLGMLADASFGMSRMEESNRERN